MDHVTNTLRNINSILSLSDTDWDLLIRQARSCELLAHLCFRLETEDLLQSAPDKTKAHFQSEKILSLRQQEAARWEVLQIHNALSSIGVPIILLKGAAYLEAGLPPAPGRFFSDIDILVPKTMIEDTEAKLQFQGWLTTHHDEYDQRYYRKWMHEIPPLQHIGRQSTIDVHHSILPLTARLHPNPEKLIQSAIQISKDFELYMLCPEDMLLHSATHLFHDGELEHGLRGLVDLDRLLIHYGSDDANWNTLIDRAIEMNLSRPLFYALHYCSMLLDTPIPVDIINSSKLDKPSKITLSIMDKLFVRALRPAHHSCNDWLTSFARWLLYIRSHYLRMPPHLLIPHLFHKSFIKPYKEWKEAKKLNAHQEEVNKTTGKRPEIDIFE